MSRDDVVVPFELDWGAVTLEAVNDERRLAVHVLNHDLETARSVDRTIRFAVGRVAWSRRQLPAGSRQLVAFDDRGQSVSGETRTRLREALTAAGADAAFFSEGFPNGL